MSTNSRTIDFKGVQNIIAKRKMVRVTDAGSLSKVFIQSTQGTTIPVLTKEGEPVLGQNGMPLMKTIYNVAANSQVAMLNSRNKALLEEGMKHETVGDMEKATELYNKYLNAIQVSFNMLLTSSSTPVFGKNDLVQGVIQLITTDNGQLLTLDKVKAVVAKELGDSKKFSLNELLGIADKPSADEVFISGEGDVTESGADATHIGDKAGN